MADAREQFEATVYYVRSLSCQVFILPNKPLVGKRLFTKPVRFPAT